MVDIVVLICYGLVFAYFQAERTDSPTTSQTSGAAPARSTRSATTSTPTPPAVVEKPSTSGASQSKPAPVVEKKKVTPCYDNVLNNIVFILHQSMLQQVKQPALVQI